LNLSGIAAGYAGAINAATICTIKQSLGYTTSPDGTQVPAYQYFPGISCQIQPISSTDLRKLDALNLQGIFQAAYINGNWSGIDRDAIKGGDLILEPNGTTWLVSTVLEAWSDWTKAAVTKQITINTGVPSNAP